MDRWQDKVAVVTGASAGIGAAIAKNLVNAGMIVVGLARRTELVEALREELPADKQSRLHAHKCDVGDGASVNAAFDWVIAQFGGVDVLVNNAGLYRPGQLVALPFEDLQQVVQTNLMGPIFCTQRAFKSMRERQFDGHVVMINSIFGHTVPPNIVPGQPPVANAYPPTKHALTALTEMYRQEFHGFNTGIKITSVSPGFVATAMLPKEIVEQVVPVQLTADEVADSVHLVLATPPNVQIQELRVKPVGEIF